MDTEHQDAARPSSVPRAVAIGIVCVFGGTVSTLVGLALTRGESPGVPGREWETVGQSAWDFGAVDRGSTHSFRLTIRRTGEKGESVPEIVTTCGCIAAEASPKSGGADGEFDVECALDTDNPGSFATEISAVQEHGGGLERIGTAKFSVRAGWHLRPERPQLEVTVGRESPPAMPIVLAADEDGIADSAIVESEHAWLSFRQEIHGNSLWLWPAVRVGDVPRGVFTVTSVIKSRSRSAPRFELPINVRHDPERFRTDPRSLFSGFVGKGRTFVCVFRMYEGTKPVLPDRVEAVTKDVIVESLGRSESGEVQLRCRVAEGVVGSRSAGLRFKINGTTWMQPIVVAVLGSETGGDSGD